jgi:hypothetical protein
MSEANQVRKLTDELAKTRAELAKAQAEVRGFKLTDSIRAAATAGKVPPDRLDDFITVLRDSGRFTLDESDRLVFKDPDGQPAIHWDSESGEAGR